MNLIGFFVDYNCGLWIHNCGYTTKGLGPRNVGREDLDISRVSRDCAENGAGAHLFFSKRILN